MKNYALIAAVLFVVMSKGAEQKEIKSVFNPQVDTKGKLFFGGSTEVEPKEKESSVDGQADNNVKEFFKIVFGGPLFKENEKRLTGQDAILIISLLNSMADDFNAEYSFAELDMPLILSKGKLFLENPKYQPKLKNLVQILKDKTSGLERFSNAVLVMEKAIQNKDAEHFFVSDSELRRLFSNPPIIPVKPLLKIGRSTGWRGTLNNIKDAVMNKAKRMYNYLFSKKHTITSLTMRWDEAAGKYVTEEKTVELE